MVISFDLIAGILSFLFTLLIFSYVLGDNPLFRIALYIFIGVSSGYIAVVAWWQVIMPRLVQPIIIAITSGNMLGLGLMLPPLLGALMLLIFPRQTGLGRLVIAFLVGVGAAVTLAGALIGTLGPQVMGTINAFDFNVINAAIVLIGTVLTLVYFHFGARPKANGSMRRLGLIEMLAWGGRVFIGIALGAVFAGVYAAALTALIERILSLITFVFDMLGKFHLL